MKTASWIKLTLVATATLFTLAATRSKVAAAEFASAEVDQNKFIAVAAPFGNNNRQLLILEQVSSKRPCWSESGNAPVSVNPLLLKFDFTGICGRSTDSNGYSIRLGNEDLNWKYLLHIVQRDGELVLVGTSVTDLNAPPLEIGRTYGMTDGFEKIILNPGWRFTKRAFHGKTLGHIYLTNDSSTIATQSPPFPNSQPQLHASVTSNPLPSSQRQPQATITSNPLPSSQQQPQRASQAAVTSNSLPNPQAQPLRPKFPSPSVTHESSPVILPRVQNPLTKLQPQAVVTVPRSPSSGSLPVAPETQTPYNFPQQLPVLTPGTEIIFSNSQGQGTNLPGNLSQPVPIPQLPVLPPN